MAENIPGIEVNINATSDSDDAAAPACNAKEEAFAREYVLDLNGGAAIFRAGCFAVTSIEAARVQASRMLSRANVQRLIDVLKAQRAARVGVLQEQVLAEMSVLANSRVDWFIIDDDGNVKLAAGAPEDAMGAVQSVKRKKTVKESKDGVMTITYDVELKLWDKPAPLKLMGRHVGLFPDKVELSGPNGGPIPVTEVRRVVVDPTSTT
jgi:phage terminase small subunit